MHQISLDSVASFVRYVFGSIPSLTVTGAHPVAGCHETSNNSSMIRKLKAYREQRSPPFSTNSRSCTIRPGSVGVLIAGV